MGSRTIRKHAVSNRCWHKWSYTSSDKTPKENLKSIIWKRKAYIQRFWRFQKCSCWCHGPHHDYWFDHNWWTFCCCLITCYGETLAQLTKLQSSVSRGLSTTNNFRCNWCRRKESNHLSDRVICRSAEIVSKNVQVVQHRTSRFDNRNVQINREHDCVFQSCCQLSCISC